MPHQLAYKCESRFVVSADRNGQWPPVEDGRRHAPHVLVAEIERLDHMGSRCRRGQLLCSREEIGNDRCGAATSDGTGSGPGPDGAGLQALPCRPYPPLSGEYSRDIAAATTQLIEPL
jgi:hypothetical protein